MSEDNSDLEKLLTEKQKQRVEIKADLDKIKKEISLRRIGLVGWFVPIPITYLAGLFASIRAQHNGFYEGANLAQMFLILYTFTIVKDYIFSYAPGIIKELRSLTKRRYSLLEEFNNLE